ncbi:hypothetical protein ASD64_07180 [Mesorhizobium sp. Root157]|uniref:glycoside hydrolase family 108 protein n=1 Tax=Mesorhizobium sp. Root157 TaxID=1736477 RepID=UPI0006F8B058|nr:glycosyl hydrolase 108 family protein [Mesorhizobium sp. Root157]KQZ87214.1 hypothetical protein ASD64_07180 [Mesorhizobium sp. Root157]
MQKNFQACLNVTLAYEGGWADNPKDPGGATMKGITLATFRRWVPKATKTQLRNITAENVAKIYREDFWNKVSGDRLASGVDLATFDAGVNSGPSRALKWLLAAAGGSDDQTVKKLCAKRLGFMQSLAIWKTFGKGWSRRVAAIEAKGVAWALAASSAPAVVHRKLQTEQVAAEKKAANHTKGAGATGTATTAGGGDVALNPQHADAIAGWVIGGLLAAGAVVVAVLIIRAIIHKHRAAAYAAEAGAVA